MSAWASQDGLARTREAGECQLRPMNSALYEVGLFRTARGGIQAEMLSQIILVLWPRRWRSRISGSNAMIAPILVAGSAALRSRNDRRSGLRFEFDSSAMQRHSDYRNKDSAVCTAIWHSGSICEQLGIFWESACEQAATPVKGNRIIL
jgi:hypothetical protein